MRVDHKAVKMILVLKLHQLQREELATLTYENLLDYLFGYRWQKEFPETLNEIASDVFSIQASDIVAYLSFSAIKDAREHTPEEYSDLFHDQNPAA